MPERVLIDTNVFIAAVDTTRPSHLAARTLIESDPRGIIATGQSQREFLSVLTRPRTHPSPSLNGLGVDGPQAAADWAAVSATVTIVDESDRSRQRLQTFVADGRASGEQVHDANLVAVALDHSATTLVTANTRHFERFAGLITIEALA